jgi:ribose 5-phosphate isomerase RpiB
MHLGIATDHGGFGLKEDQLARLRAAGHHVVDFGANALNPDDDYPDFVRASHISRTYAARSGAGRSRAS